MDLKGQDDGMIPMGIKSSDFSIPSWFSLIPDRPLSNPVPKDPDFSRFEFNQEKPKLLLKENSVGMKREFDSQNSNSMVPEGIRLPEFQFHGAKEGVLVPNPSSC